MSALTPSEFKARFPQYASVDDSVIQALINDTLCSFDIDRWGCFYKRGHSLYVAHLLTLQTQQESGNAGSGSLDRAQSKAADGVSVSYATMTPSNYNEAFFAGTSYGSEYLMMLRSVGIGATCCGC